MRSPTATACAPRSAMRRAIASTRTARFEYELEAEATYWLTKNGAQEPAYPAIVASGPNGNAWHYEDNGRRLQPGDLVFFKTMRQAFSHVGIYLGDNRFIHAPKPGAVVRTENMQVSYWRTRFDGARRIIE